MSVSRLRPRRDDDRGAVALFVAGLLVVFLGLAAIVVDLGNTRDASRQAQNAADAGALAAATCMASLTSGCNNTTAATKSARDYITANGWDGANATISFDLTAETVSVTLPAQQQATFFAGALDQDSPTVARSAAATWTGAGTGCSLCVLNNLDVAANADLNMDQGDLLVNGGLTLGPNASVLNSGGRIFVNGGISTKNGSVLQDITGILTPALVAPAGTITPPLVDVSAVLGRTVSPNPSGACTAGATGIGTYASVDRCTSFGPGVYVLTGASSFTGNGTIQATGVTFVLTCSSTVGGTVRSSPCPANTSGGSIEVKGQVTVNVSVSSPPVYASICFGLAIVSDPNNTGGVSVNGTGNGGNGRLNVDGSIYLKSGTLTYGGGPDLTVNGNILVGNYSGNGNKGILHALGCGPGRGAGGAGVHLSR
jgi:Flp pilus assembly protein TadG